jgi:multidrug efflux pump subunit AcrA (membrane-fusion protein)
VTSIDVAIGDTVTVGQQLASLDTASLEADLADAQAELAQAEAALEATKNGQTESVTEDDTSTLTSGSAGEAPASSVPATESSTTPTDDAGSGSAPPDAGAPDADVSLELSELQQAVIIAQNAVDRSLAQASTALAAQQEICATSMTAASASYTTSTASVTTTAVTTTPTEIETSTPTPTPTETETSTPTPTPTESPDSDLESCVAALQAAQNAQQQAASDQNSLQAAITALAHVLTAASSVDGGSGAPGGDDGSDAPGGDGGSGAPSDGGDRASPTSPDVPDGSGTERAAPEATAPDAGSSTSMAPGGTALSEAAQLASDQAAINEAELAVLQAQQAMDAATLVAPIAGTVAEIDLTVGSAADSSATLTIVGSGEITVTSSVSESTVRQLEVGTTVQVQTAGAPESIDGQVVSIGVMPDTSTGSTAYPVVIGVEDTPDNAATGIEAEVSFLIGEVEEVLTVPNSAVTLTADGGTVRRLNSGDAEVLQVEIGAVGSERTEIVNGLEAGDVVVLAEITADVPTTENESGLGGGGFTGFGGGRPSFGGGAGGGFSAPLGD